MKRLFLLLFLLSTIDSFSQINSLTVNFRPSFHENSQLLIAKENSNYSITIQSSKISEKCLLTDSLMSDLQLLLVDYSKQKFTLDSIERVKQLEMAKDGGISISVDGIRVSGVLLDKRGERSFNIEKPQKGTIDNQLMSLLFKLMYSSFTKPETITYVLQLEGYFSLGFGVKKLSESPLSYKLYGSISSNEKKELSDFFRQLPSDTEIYIDMSNFAEMATMFYGSFYTLCERNRTIYWINCSAAAKRHLSNAGIVSSSIK